MGEEVKGKIKPHTNIKKKQRKKKSRVKLILLSLVLSAVLAIVALGAFMGVVLAGDYEIDESRLVMPQASMIYDRNGNNVQKEYLENRKYVPLSQIPDQLIHAFIAVEDQRFYDHGGFDTRAIGRALYRDIMARRLVEGGSTITQQLAKNVFLYHDKKWMRKTEEVLIAVNLEKRYEKNEILEMYLNYIHFGHGAYGVQAASQLYFNKDVEELQAGEIALLVALPKGPALYSPFIEGSEERSENRRLLVLRIMTDHGLISEEERSRAAGTPLQLEKNAVTKNPALATYIDMVYREAEEKYELTTNEILTGGYHIYTSLDFQAQEAMYDAFQPDSELAEQLFPDPGPDRIVEGSMVILDHHTGAIVAVSGGREYVTRGTNRATAQARQPGSTFKPFVSYGPALEEGWNPYDMVKDEQRTYGNYAPRNLGNKYRGNVTMMEALQWSYNAPAVWLLNELGMRTGIQYANAFGFEQVTADKGLGIALGGAIEVSPLQMANAYGAFAFEGIMMEPYLIDKIVDQHGAILFQKQSQHKQIVSSQTAWYMTKMLQRVVTDGTGKGARLTHDVAGKTGTTQSNQGSGISNSWFVGYTPQYTSAVWIGFDVEDENHVMRSGVNYPALIFKHVMEQLLANQDPQFFEKPTGVDELRAPVRLQAINDLSASVVLDASFNFHVELSFTPNQDERVHYDIYRINQVNNRTTKVASLKKDDIAGKVFRDSQVDMDTSYEYVVIPINSIDRTEGEESNSIMVVISPFSSSLRLADDVDEAKLEEWRRELLGESEEEELPEETPPPVEEERPPLEVTPSPSPSPTPTPEPSPTPTPEEEDPDEPVDGDPGEEEEEAA